MMIEQMTAQSEGLSAEYQILGRLPAARADLALPLRVEVRNRGAVAWLNEPAHPINLSYHWLDPHEQVVDFDGQRANLPAPLLPGQSVELELLVEPPPRAGEYLLALDLVEEMVGWFSARGVAPLVIPISVALPPADALRVCIVNGNCTVNDAVGNHVVNQLRYFLERGYQALALVEAIDQRQPAEIRQHVATITPAELRHGPLHPTSRRAVKHFHNADIYVFNYSTYYPLVEAIHLVGRGVLIFDYHGITPPHLWEGPGLETLIEGQRQLGLVRYADYAIAHSSFTGQELIETGAVAPERVFVMPYVVPLDLFGPGPRDAELVARYGLEGRPVLLYVGRMAGNKRIIDLVRALPLIDAYMPGVVLLLVGDDRSPAYAGVVAEAREQAAALGCAEQVIFAGPIDHSQLDRFYRTCDVYVTSSLHEGFCIPVVEAMACGRPVVGAHAAALPETIGPAGFTFAPANPADLADKVLRILASATGDRTWGAHAVEHVSQG
jgi:glycosyltransferase involved in cell wall biosynthesis